MGKGALRMTCALAALGAIGCAGEDTTEPDETVITVGGPGLESPEPTEQTRQLGNSAATDDTGDPPPAGPGPVPPGPGCTSCPEPERLGARIRPVERTAR